MGDLVQAGLQTVNSLCESLKITVYRDGRKYQQDYIRGIPQHELFIDREKHASGTEIIMKPDTAIFGYGEFSEDKLRKWMENRHQTGRNFLLR